MQTQESVIFQNNKAISHIHLIAICGTAMGALASMLKGLGYRVTGSDQNIYPPMSHFLTSQGIVIFQGYDSAHLNGRPDLVVVGNAVSRDNPEVRAMQDLGLAYCSMPQAINRFIAAGKRQIVVTGTHGKTTTSSFIAWLLHSAAMAPSFLIGGILSNFNANYLLGQGQYIVLEGDEYDTAFFDKGPKFLHYTPNIAIITSVEFDHADIFHDLDHVKQTFGALIEHLPAHAQLLVYDGDANAADLLISHPHPAIMYGHSVQSDWRLGEISIASPFSSFEVFHHNQLYAEFKTRMIGRHNMLNFLAGIAVGESLKIDRQTMADALATFQGVHRRQQVRGVKNNIVVIDDFAHHPTAVKVTIEAVKAFYNHRRLVAVFEPRTNSSRRRVFQTIYPDCFDAADLICVRQAPLLDKIPQDERFSSQELVSDLRRRGLGAYFFADTDAILNFLVENAVPNDVILIMSNGGFDNIHQRLLDLL